MTQDIDAIISELIAIDPDLRTYEEQLRSAVATLAKERPHAEPDTVFVAALRQRLQEQATQRMEQQGFSSLFSPLLTMKYIYALAGAVAGIALTAPGMYFALRDGSPVPLPTQQYALRAQPEDDQREPEAFGSLSVRMQEDSNAAEVLGLGGGSPDSKAFPMPPSMHTPSVQYDFLRTQLDLPEDTVDVLRRMPLVAEGAVHDMDLIDLSSFRDSYVSNFSLTQEAEQGYIVQVNARDGTVSIYRNMEQWPDLLYDCEGPECERMAAIDPDDLPADNELLAIADAFILKHGINLQGYGEPFVLDDWRNQPHPEGSLPAAPPELQVLYPMQIDGLPVYEQSGQLAGMAVSVDVRTETVSGVWNIMNQSFQRSAYPAITEPDAVFDYIQAYEMPAVPMYIPFDSKEEVSEEPVVHISLGVPEYAYIRYHQFDGTEQRELFVPGFIFPIVESDGAPSYFHHKAIAVPLAESLLE